MKILYKSEKDNINKKKLNDIESFKEEVNIMKELQGENFVYLKEYFEDNEGYYIVMEYCNCNLSDLLNSKYQQGMSIELIKKIFFQLNKALMIMRQSNITHRDLKTANILIKYTEKDFNENDFIVKLSDFGLSTELSITQSNLTISGTFKYMAPEVENGKYNNKVDLWSIGVILYELKTCQYIFKGKSKKDEIDNRYNGIIKKTGYKDLDDLIQN
jgi:serine/threonine protein kinase